MDDDPLVARLRAAGCVFAEDEAAELRAAARDPTRPQGRAGDALEELARRRVAGEPLEQVLGRVRFAGLDVRVEPGVFVPRRRTELLVEEAARWLAGGAPGDEVGRAPVLVELCCGAGAITRALLDRVPGLLAWAGDVDPVAVRCAAATLGGLPGVLGVGVSDLDAAVPPYLAGGVDVLAAHVPYVPTGALATLPREARDHEPRRALDGGADGLDLLRAVARLAPRWLGPGGALLAEVARAQLPSAAAAYRDAGLTPVVVEEDPEDTEHAGRGGLVLCGERAGAA